MKTLIQLFLIFARVGGFTFGGGYAMLPMLQKELVENKGWTTNEDLIDYYAIGQCTPGIIAVNVATFVGYKTKGVLGGIFATLGMITPSIIIVGIIAAFLHGFQDYQVVQWAFSGIRAAVVALIISAMWKIAKKSLVDIFAVIIFLAVTVLSFFTDLSPVVFVLVAGVCGLLLNMTGIRKAKEEKKK
jgi:chromate transporter